MSTSKKSKNMPSKILNKAVFKNNKISLLNL